MQRFSERISTSPHTEDQAELKLALTSEGMLALHAGKASGMHRSLTCGWSARSWIRHCAVARGAPTVLLISGVKLKVTVDGDALD